MAAPVIAEGRVALLYVRVRSVYLQSGLACVRFATLGSAGGPGFEQIGVPLIALKECAIDPDNDAVVPPFLWGGPDR